MDRQSFRGAFVALILPALAAGCIVTDNRPCRVSGPCHAAACSGCGEPLGPATPLNPSACGHVEACEPLMAAPVVAAPGCSARTDAACGCGEGCVTADSQQTRHHSGLTGGFERGRPNIVLDGAGWIVGIPQKILLWNTKVDSHSVSPETEEQLRRYLASRGLDDVKVRINQYDPVGEWKRLVGNEAINAGWRYTIGTLTVARYTLMPGRLVGADDYNPFTNTISLYSDRPSIALREGAHAKRALEANYPGTWAAASYIPGSPLWVDYPAIREVIAYSRQTGDRAVEREAYLVLFPAYGARISSSATLFLDAGVGGATQGAFALLGHVAGRTMAFRVSDTPIQMVKSVYGIVRRKTPDEDGDSTADADEKANENTTADIHEVPPADLTYPVTFVPVDVIYAPVGENI